MIVEASIASIPYKPGMDQVLGPTSYNPNLALTKPKTLSTNFSVSTAKRDMFEYKGNIVVGPGRYLTGEGEGKEKQKNSWTFASKVSKNTEGKTEPAPGPGAYNPKYYKRHPRVLVEGFGSTTERDISLTNDPYHPYANNESFQSTGMNDSLNSAKAEIFRQKYLNPKPAIIKPAFGTSEKRESKWANTDIAVGPGDYHSRPIATHSPKLPNKSPRFKESKPTSIPGPGAYDVKEPPLRTHSYIGQSNRFKEDKHEAPENYIPHRPWKVKQNRSPDVQYYEPNLRFESSSPRFPLSTTETPGPGQYLGSETKKSMPSVIHSTEVRFGGHGSYIPQTVTDTDIGPGTYHKDAKLGKKTFNISPDIGDDRPWI